MTYFQQPRSKHREWSPAQIAKFEELERIAGRRGLSHYQMSEAQALALFPDDDFRERAHRLVQGQFQAKQESDDEESLSPQEQYEQARNLRRDGR